MPSVIEKEEIVKEKKRLSREKKIQQEADKAMKAAESVDQGTLVDKYAGMTGIPGAKGKRVGRQAMPTSGGIQSLGPQPGVPQRRPSPQPMQRPQGSPQMSPLMASQTPQSPRMDPMSQGPGQPGAPLQFNEGREVRPPKEGAPILGKEVAPNPDYVRRRRELDEKRKREDELMKYRSYLKRTLDPSLRGVEGFDEGGSVGGDDAGESGGLETVPSDIAKWATENPVEAASIGLLLTPWGWGIGGGIKLVSLIPKAYRFLKAGTPGKALFGKYLQKIPGVGKALTSAYGRAGAQGLSGGRMGPRISPEMVQSRVGAGATRQLGRIGAAGALGAGMYGLKDMFGGEGSDPEQSGEATGNQAGQEIGASLSPAGETYKSFRRHAADIDRHIPGTAGTLGYALTAGGAGAMSGDRTSWGGDAVNAFNEALNNRRIQNQRERLELLRQIPQEQQALSWQEFATNLMKSGAISGASSQEEWQEAEAAFRKFSQITPGGPAVRKMTPAG